VTSWSDDDTYQLTAETRSVTYVYAVTYTYIFSAAEKSAAAPVTNLQARNPGLVQNAARFRRRQCAVGQCVCVSTTPF
jgi:hypothetical protein